MRASGNGKQDEEAEWDGISEVILGKKEWFEAWMEGERSCEFFVELFNTHIDRVNVVAMDQYIEIISAADAWLIADETVEDEEGVVDRELKPTNSARRVKALVEQVTGKPHTSCLAYRQS